jgi:hypothetical protein
MNSTDFYIPRDKREPQTGCVCVRDGRSIAPFGYKCGGIQAGFKVIEAGFTHLYYGHFSPI